MCRTKVVDIFVSYCICVALRCIVLCCVALYRVVLCLAVLCCVVLCCVLLCCVVLCCVVLCLAVLCCVVLVVLSGYVVSCVVLFQARVVKSCRLNFAKLCLFEIAFGYTKPASTMHVVSGSFSVAMPGSTSYPGSWSSTWISHTINLL